MKDQGLVSIITPSFNCSSYISETIEAIQAQTYNNWELLITDDCSSDSSREVIQSFVEKDHRIKLFLLEKNSGAGVARNNSIKRAQGKFIAFCDSDDRWYPEKLEKQLQFMIDNNAILSYSSYDVCDENGVIKGYVECQKELNLSKIIRDNGIGCLTAIYDAERIGKQYMPDMRKRQDWCLWIDIIQKVGIAKGFQQPMAIYRDRSNSISSNKSEMLKYNYEVYHSFLKRSSITSWAILLVKFMPYYFYKKLKQKVDWKKRERLIK